MFAEKSLSWGNTVPHKISCRWLVFDIGGGSGANSRALRLMRSTPWETIEPRCGAMPSTSLACPRRVAIAIAGKIVICSGGFKLAHARVHRDGS
jgi:hypothetical protein